MLEIKQISNKIIKVQLRSIINIILYKLKQYTKEKKLSYKNLKICVSANCW